MKSSGIKLTEAEAAEAKYIKAFIRDLCSILFKQRPPSGIGKQYVARISIYHLIELYRVMRGINYSRGLKDTINQIIDNIDFAGPATAPEACLYDDVKAAAFNALRLLVLHNAPLRIVEVLQFCSEAASTYAVNADYDITVPKRRQLAKDLTKAIRAAQEIEAVTDKTPEGLKKPGQA